MSGRPAAAAVERCDWAEGSDPLLREYHDIEWGVPNHEDRRHFEFLTLEGAQAGLNWLTILRKRAGYSRAFGRFDPVRVARFTAARRARLVDDPGIVRHRAKIDSVIGNARAFLGVQKEFGSFDAYCWPFVGGRPRHGRWSSLGELPPRSAEADALSEDLRRRGFRFVGPTIVYSYMQAVGLVNDHLRRCFRYAEVRDLEERGPK